MEQDAYLDINRLNWDERVAHHLAAPSYDLRSLRAGLGALDAVAEMEIGHVKGKAVLHLQCHFGRDTLTIAQRGADVVGLDFSGEAIRVARLLATELGLDARSSFVEADVYSAPQHIDRKEAFDLVLVNWGSLCWLPDLRQWAEIVAYFLKPGGNLYLLETHPSMSLFYDPTAAAPRRGMVQPYFTDGPIQSVNPFDYANPEIRLRNAQTLDWAHPLGNIVNAIIEAGLTIEWLHEHDCVPWRLIQELIEGEDGMFRWPKLRWLPLGVSIRASRNGQKL